MRTVLNVIFFVLGFAALGACALAFAFHIVDLATLFAWLETAYADLQTRWTIGATGVLLILISLAAVQALTGKMQREKTIAFTNPNGQVTVTLSAVEDLIKRLANQFNEIKEAKADVKATKKGIDIRMRVVLRSETNIPDFTARLQEMISSRVQDVFGIDEPILVRIHVAKIITTDDRAKRPADRKTDEITVPYQGIKI
jgi:uncharacterized alkaline shock family protein YloU